MKAGAQPRVVAMAVMAFLSGLEQETGPGGRTATVAVGAGSGTGLRGCRCCGGVRGRERRGVRCRSTRGWGGFRGKCGGGGGSWSGLEPRLGTMWWERERVQWRWWDEWDCWSDKGVEGGGGKRRGLERVQERDQGPGWREAGSQEGVTTEKRMTKSKPSRGPT